MRAGKMDLIFVDDSKQAAKKIARPGMGSLVAVGGFHLPGSAVRALSRELDRTCENYGFPANEEFKWSPNKGSWMKTELVGRERRDFLAECLEAAAEHDAQACVVIADETHRTTERKRTGHELDVVKMFLERCHNHLTGEDTEAILVADQPSGGRPAEAAFVGSCLEHLRDGTAYADLDRVALVLTENSKNLRLLQLADLIVGCTLSFVGGEAKYSPPIFTDCIKPLLREEQNRVGGVGLKLHADLRYVNLYHWLIEDSHYVKGNVGHPLPSDGHPYATSPDQV
jgi:Protein of unknown function (DUF3800)